MRSTRLALTRMRHKPSAAVRTARSAVLTAIAALSMACAVFATKSELRLVHQLETETDPLSRVEVLSSYDSQFASGGRLTARVEPMRGEIENDLWTYVENTGLQEGAVRAYLSQYPEGPHAALAQRRLDQIRYFAEADAARHAAKLRAEEQERQRIEEQNERQRDKVRAGLENWLRAAITVPRWGAKLTALAAMHPPFQDLWAGEPAPLCVQQTCRRTIEARYFFARIGQTRVDRTISLVLQVDMREGRVYQIIGYYTGRGFVDWWEMSSAQIIEDEGAEHRETARDAMVAMFHGVVAELIAEPTVVEADQEEILARFRYGEVEISLEEFPQTFAAGRVDGFRVTFQGDLTQPPPPPVAPAPPAPPVTEPEPQPAQEPTAEPQANEDPPTNMPQANEDPPADVPQANEDPPPPTQQ